MGEVKMRAVASASGPVWAAGNSSHPSLLTLAALPIPVIVCRPPDLEIAFVNQAAAGFLGHTNADLCAMTLDQITTPQGDSHVRSSADEAQRDSAVVHRTFHHADGTTRSAGVHLLTFPDLCGYEVSLLCDVTSHETSIGRLGTLANAAALVPGADIGLDAVSDAVRAMAAEQFREDVAIEWFDAPRPIVEARDCHPRFENEMLRCPIVVTDASLGEIRLRSQGDEETRLSVQSLANCLAGAASVAALEKSLRSAGLFELGFEASNVGMQIVSDDGIFLRVNEAFARMVGRPVADLIGRSWTEVTHPDDIEIYDGEACRRLDADRSDVYRDVKRYLRPDGRIAFGSITITSLDDDRDFALPIRLVQVVDVTDPIRSLQQLATTRQELAASERRYRSLVEPAPDAVFRIDTNGVIVDANAAAERIFGFTSISELPMNTVLPRKFAGNILTMTQESVATGRPDQIDRQWVSLDDGSTEWFSTRVIPEAPHDDSPTAHVVMSNITETVKNEQRLSAIANTDGLTGVANRAAVYDRLDASLERLAYLPGHCVAVAAVDIDHFKSLNDSFGHAFGDDALRLFATALGNELRSEDSLGRLGGDKFLLVLDGLPSEEAARSAVQRIVDRITPLRIDVEDGRSIELSASAGLVVVRAPEDVDDVVGAADRALLEAKRSGRSQLKVAGRNGGVAGSRPSLRTQMRDLLGAESRGEYELLYQPIVGTEGYATSVEALIRWNHPLRGSLSPEHFIDALIDSGHIERVGRWIVSTAVGQIEQWDRDGLDRLSLSVNVSPGELAHPGFCDHLRATINEASVDPSRFSIEITELALAGTFVPTSMLDEISSIGSRIVLDDFGTGVSSLTHLRAKALSGIKIDKSFLADAGESAVDRGIVEGMIALAHNIGVDVTVEGVETVAQAQWLSDSGCESMQGWLFSKAVAASAVPDLARHRFDFPTAR